MRRRVSCLVFAISLTIKKVALIFSSFRMSKARPVTTVEGPSSKVRYTRRAFSAAAKENAAVVRSNCSPQATNIASSTESRSTAGEIVSAYQKCALFSPFYLLLPRDML